MDEGDHAFDDQNSIGASIVDDLEPSDRSTRSPLFGIPSIPSHHSGFRSEVASDRDAESEDSSGPWSPPAWRRAGAGWFKQPPEEEHAENDDAPSRLAQKSRSRSRDTSPSYESAGEGDVTLPARGPLISPTPRRTPVRGTEDAGQRPKTEARNGASSEIAAKSEPPPRQDKQKRQGEKNGQSTNPNNFIRFAVRAEVQHRTEPFEAAFEYVRSRFYAITKSRSSTFLACMTALFSFLFLRMLFQPPRPALVPDLVKVAGLAKSFEPLIYYSENGVQQVGDLQETGVAVWDLGESVRSTNMTSAPIIVRGLDELSDSLKTLSIELTKFFANVDGDVDSILIVMEWAKRELAQLSTPSVGTLTSAFDNLHSALCRIGLLESRAGTPTTVGRIVNDLLGPSTPQRTKATLQRTFNEFLGVLEESINSELTHSTALFALFEAIDKQFLNLQRTVIRETDAQEREEGELLSSLWTRVIGANASRLRKFEKNRRLLASVRDRTVRNKHILVDHNGKLLQLKSNLEILRKKLVSPLVRSNDSSTLSVEEQIRGLDSTYDHLRTVRERQKGKLMEILYGAGNRRAGLVRGEEGTGIDAG